MTIRFENAHFWRKMKTGGYIALPSTEATGLKTVVKCTAPVVLWGFSITPDGEVGEKFLVGHCDPGDTPVRISHGIGVGLAVEFAKGECYLYDDREDTASVAPVGETFTRFEKQGLRVEDPMQVIIHRDEVRKRLERIVARGEQQPDQVADLRKQMAGMQALIEKLMPKESAGEADGTAGAEQT